MSRPAIWDEQLAFAMAEPGEWFKVDVPGRQHNLHAKLKEWGKRLGGRWEMTTRGIAQARKTGCEYSLHFRYLGE